MSRNHTTARSTGARAAGVDEKMIASSDSGSDGDSGVDGDGNGVGGGDDDGDGALAAEAGATEKPDGPAGGGARWRRRSRRGDGHGMKVPTGGCTVTNAIAGKRGWWCGRGPRRGWRGFARYRPCTQGDASASASQTRVLHRGSASQLSNVPIKSNLYLAIRFILFLSALTPKSTYLTEIRRMDCAAACPAELAGAAVPAVGAMTVPYHDPFRGRGRGL